MARSHPRLPDPRRIRAIALLGLTAVLFAACGSSGSSAAKSSTTSKPATTTTTSSTGDTPAFVDIETCDNNGGSGSASGTIENQGSTATGYRIRIAFTDASSKKSLTTEQVQLGVIQPGATGQWSLTTTGLGNADVVCHTIELSALSGDSGATGSGTAGAEFPCDLVAQAEVEQIAGNPLDPGDATTDHVSENRATWTAHSCAWTQPSAQNPTEITIAVSRAADFPSGKVECPSLSSSIPQAGLGTSAQWSLDDAGTTIVVGDLRVCSSDLLLNVHVDGADGGVLLTAARAMATKVLAAA